MNLLKIAKLFLLMNYIQKSIEEPLANPPCPTGYSALVPRQLIGKEFTIDFLGLGDDLFSTITFSLPGGSNQPVVTFETFETTDGYPHEYFNDTYASILYKDPDGITQYQKDYIGNKKLIPQKKTFNLTGSSQEEISLFHRESNRYLLKNKSQNSIIPYHPEQVEIVNVTYQLANNALIPEEFIGDKFTIHLLDSNGKNFLNTVIDRSSFDKPSITFESKSSTPDKNSTDIYAGIMYINANYSRGYAQAFYGDDEITPEKFSFLLSCGGVEEITALHKNSANIKVENHRQGKMINPYLIQGTPYFSGSYHLVQDPLPHSITTPTPTTSTSTSTTSTTTPYSTVPLTTAMASTPSPSASAAFSSYPAALAPLLATGMLLTQ